MDGVIGLRGKRVLDYGCGPAYLLEHLLNLGITCEGVDFSKNTVATANQRLGGNPLFRGAHWASELPTALTANRYESSSSLKCWNICPRTWPNPP